MTAPLAPTGFEHLPRTIAAAVPENDEVELDALLGFDVDLAAVPEAAIRAERLGFGALWTAETRHDPFLPLALVAEHTSRIHLGTAVAVAFARSPTVLAQTAWDLAARSHGRFILGLGTQVRAHVERRFAMPWSGRPVAQLRDYLAAIRAIWRGWQTGEPVRHRGTHYQVTLMTPFFSPAPIDHPGIPIYLAGVGAVMCRLAGEAADGLIVHPLHSPLYLADVVLPAVESGAARSGRDRTAVRIAGTALVAIGENGRERVREQIAFYASTPSYRPVLELHGWAEIGAALSRLARRGRWAEMPALVTEPMIDAFSVSSSWDGLAARLRDRYDGLLDQIAVYHAFGASADDPGWQRLAAGFGPRQR
jgi:probable F420-dependent oxidoreductase